MAQQTLVMKLGSAEQSKLERDVRAGDFEMKSVPHARFSARAPGVTATLYRSGKLVVQGADAQLFLDRYVGAGPAPASAAAQAARNEPGPATGPLIGGDESGKGDYFGPLVVAAVRVTPETADKLRAGGVMDSKKVTDETALRLGGAIRTQLPCALRVLHPPEYTRRQAEHGNVALLLSELYREVVEELAAPGDAVLIDQFSKNKDRLESAFRGLDIKLHQEHKAERAVSVAAASLVAREAFLVGLRELGEEVGARLPKGAGPPVLRAGRELIRDHGPGILDRVAKVHFKTTAKLR